MAVAYHKTRKLADLVLTFLNKLEVKILGEHSQTELHHLLSKCFSKADPFATIKWLEGVSAALFSFWRTRQWVRLVEAIRQKLTHSLPLVLVSVEGNHVDEDVLAGLYIEPTSKLGVPLKLIH